MRKQDKPKTNINQTIHPHHTNKIKQGRDYFIVGPDKETNMVTSATTTWELHNKYSNVFRGAECFKGTFLFHVKKAQNHTKHYLDAWYTRGKNYSATRIDAQ